MGLTAFNRARRAAEAQEKQTPSESDVERRDGADARNDTRGASTKSMKPTPIRSKEQ